MTFQLTPKMSPLLTSADTHVGRFDPAMLTDHQLMELFFTPDESDPGEFHQSGDQDDVCSWKGVTCTEEKSVTKITWASYHFNMAGTLDFTKIPQKVKQINFYDLPLYGEVEICALPQSMMNVCLQDCKFSGSLDIRALPRQIESFIVKGNQITSVGDICDLPRSLRVLKIGESAVTHKNLHVAQLPSTGIRVDLSGCGFTKITFENQEDAMFVNYFFTSW